MLLGERKVKVTEGVWWSRFTGAGVRAQVSMRVCVCVCVCQLKTE